MMLYLSSDDITSSRRTWCLLQVHNNESFSLAWFFECATAAAAAACAKLNEPLRTKALKLKTSLIVIHEPSLSWEREREEPRTSAIFGLSRIRSFHSNVLAAAKDPNSRQLREHLRIHLPFTLRSLFYRIIMLLARYTACGGGKWAD